MDIDDHRWTCDSDPLLILDVPGIPWVSSARQHLSLSGSSNTAAAVASPTVTYYHYHPQGTNCGPTTAATTTTSAPAKSTEPSDDIRIYQVERGQKDKQCLSLQQFSRQEAGGLRRRYWINTCYACYAYLRMLRMLRMLCMLRCQTGKTLNSIRTLRTALAHALGKFCGRDRKP
jgi:hypothetical protein